jgi:hypothetical protein
MDRVGEGTGVHSVTKKLRRLFPKLFGDQYRLASPRTKKYNCMSWAAGRNDVWSEAPPDGVWPEGVPDDGSVDAAIRFFESLGFARTSLDDIGSEAGVEKVAIYGDQLGYTHAARQLPDGEWSSKIGKLQDIEHSAIDALTSSVALMGTFNDKAYGRVLQIMRKSTGS